LDSGVPFVVGGDDFPRGEVERGALEHVLGGLDVLLPLFAVAPILVVDFPAFVGVGGAGLEAAELFLLGDVEEDFDDADAGVVELAFEFEDFGVCAFPVGGRAESFDALDEHASVPRTVEDGDASVFGQAQPEAAQTVLEGSWRQEGKGLARRFTLRLAKKGGERTGLVFNADLDPHLIAAVERIGERNTNSPVLLLTSVLGAPLWKAARQRNLIPANIEISIVANRFFGGSICCAGLLTVDDFETHLRERIPSFEHPTGQPPVVLAPTAPFDRRGFDLLGVHYRELKGRFPGLSILFL